MRKCMVEFLRKFYNRAIKSGRDNSILITKAYQFRVIYFTFVRCCGFANCDVDKFELIASAQSIIEKSMVQLLYLHGFTNYNREQ